MTKQLTIITHTETGAVENYVNSRSPEHNLVSSAMLKMGDGHLMFDSRTRDKYKSQIVKRDTCFVLHGLSISSEDAVTEDTTRWGTEL